MSALYRHTLKQPAALLLAVLFIALAVLTGCSKQPEVFSQQGMTMGTSFTVKWVGSGELDRNKLAEEIKVLLAAINDSMSTYQKDSELSQINRLPAGQVVNLSQELKDVLSRALEISQSSGGAFDVTVGPLVNLWGFGPDGRIVKAPSEEQILNLRDRVGYHYLQLNNNELTKVKDAYIDLSAIAKGYGVDKLAELLEHKGVASYLVEIGGELRARGLKPDGSHWRIAIEAPETGTRKVQRIIEVKDVGIATSGDYRNYFEEDGVRFSHTIDPSTGKPITHRLASVTVLAADCASADALATTMMVLGPEKALEFAQTQGVEAMLIVKTEQGFSEQMTPGFNQYLVQ